MSVIPTWCVNGAKVVCINDSPCLGASRASVDGLTKGMVYTIREVKWDAGAGEFLLLLHEIVRAFDIESGDDIWGEMGYIPWRFRPHITKTPEQDIEAFLKLVRDIPAEGRLDLIAELLE